MQQERQIVPAPTRHRETLPIVPQPTLLEEVIIHSLMGVRLEISPVDNRNDARQVMIVANRERTQMLREKRDNLADRFLNALSPHVIARYDQFSSLVYKRHSCTCGTIRNNPCFSIEDQMERQASRF